MAQLQTLQHQTKRYQHLQLSMHHSHLHHHHRNHNSNQVTAVFPQAHVSHQVTCERTLFHVQVPVTYIRKRDIQRISHQCIPFWALTHYQSQPAIEIHLHWLQANICANCRHYQVQIDQQPLNLAGACCGCQSMAFKGKQETYHKCIPIKFMGRIVNILPR